MRTIDRKQVLAFVTERDAMYRMIIRESFKDKKPLRTRTIVTKKYEEVTAPFVQALGSYYVPVEPALRGTIGRFWDSNWLHVCDPRYRSKAENTGSWYAAELMRDVAKHFTGGKW